MYTAIQRQQMLSVAHDAILHGANLGTRIKLQADNYAAELLQPRATFVTLKIDGLLRGCIGSLAASETLIEDLAHNAYSAAFRDPRFDPVGADEIPQLYIEISILSDLVTLEFDSEQQLISQLRPNLDGLVLHDKDQSATFLPAIWEQVPRAEDFITRLKEKAGWPADYWSETLSAQHFTVTSICSHP